LAVALQIFSNPYTNIFVQERNINFQKKNKLDFYKTCVKSQRDILPLVMG